ncbi:MAG: Ig domain-containing protein [Nanoarchaeota archaeon]
MKKIILIIFLFATLNSIMLLNFVSSTATTISANASYNDQGTLYPNNANGVLFVSEINQTLVSIQRSYLDNAPFCIVVDGTTNQIIFNSTWTNNVCNVNIQLVEGNLYRIATAADSGTYQDGYDVSYSPAYYPGIGNFIGGCYSYNCQTYTLSSTMYSIESITVSSEPAPYPPILSSIGNQTAPENQTLTIQLQATDPNLNDTLTFLTNAQTTLPSYSFLNSTSGLFTWTPNFNEQGFYQATFYVTDGQFIDYETVNIHVLDVNFATITLAGNASIGNNLILNIHDPQSPYKTYVLGAAFGSSPGIPLGDGRIVPLNEDWLFNAVLYVPSLFGFTNSIGTLDSQGNAQVTWTIPNLSFFQNANISFSFATLNDNAQGLQIFRSIAPAVNVTIQ